MTLVKRPSVERLRELFDYEPKTGALMWRVARPRGVKPGDLAGSIAPNGRSFYRLVGIQARLYKVHVIGWAIFYGAWPECDIDHVNHDGLDNRIENLREASVAQNSMNKRSYFNSSSKFKGACFNRNRWKSAIEICGIGVHIGNFLNERDAALAYDRAAIFAFGEFARPNFPASVSEHVILPDRVLSKIANTQKEARL